MLLQSILLLVLITSTCFAASAKQEIVVGASLPLKAEGKQIQMGMQAAFNHINAKDGPLRFALESLDDNKNLGKSIKNIKELQEKTPYFLGLFTPGVVYTQLESLREGKLLLFGPEENSTYLYEDAPANLIFTRPSIRDEIVQLVKYVTSTLKRRKVAIFYVDSPYGRNARNDAREVLKEYDLTPAVEAAYPARTVEIGRAVDAIVASQPDAIICLGRRHASYNFLLGVVNKGLIRAAFMGTSYLIPMQQYLKDNRGIDLIATSVVPNPWRSKRADVQEYREAMQKHYALEPFSPMSLASYLATRKFTDIAGAIAGPITPAAIAQEASKRTLIEPLWLSTSFNQPWMQVGS